MATQTGPCIPLPREFFDAFERLVDAFRGLDVTRHLDRIECHGLVLEDPASVNELLHRFLTELPG